jgi:TonB family protein
MVGSGWKSSCTSEGVMTQSYTSTPGDPKGTGDHMFRSLEFNESRQRTFWASVGFHGVMLTVILLIPLIFTSTIKKLKYDTVLLAPPPPEKQILEVTHYKMPPPPKPEARPVERLVAPPPVKPFLVEPPKVELPKTETPPEPLKIAEVKMPEVIERAKPLPINAAEPAAPAPSIAIKTGSFSTGSSAKPTLELPARDVQTGGFGDPNGIPGVGKPGKIANIASLGSFDLPVGAGAGNGTGGAKGVKGTVASAGFGNGVAPVGNGGGGGGNGGGGSGRAVRQGGFGDADAPKGEAAPRKRDLGPPQTAVEILSKPRPEYTDEARKLKLEGEVLLRVLFTAGGEVRVLDVVRGLGHGLDENATRAAQQIKFKPAQRDGQPVDSTATVHIVFQLAY